MLEKVKKQLPADVRIEVEQWLNQIGGILHWWEADGTYFVVVSADDQLYFLRLLALHKSPRF